ncbi:conserved hypothetical protein [Deferribacter desulfuricans SSM1]|uniref:Uncharacterized protein n=1 Tax=Deferribacter desulfuricans (strain DSM 14783 / JCM 11476 / NBRC 101012 / SSM1) TaxID=639282 RepID=D3PDN0_DEFDS|nr:hypothetical protein [Deferribacter desulfuricans]BAI80703.1 conserved hypothetical protein [Deferribacter desulfuricans SSM1]
MEKWMAVFDDMRFEEVKFDILENSEIDVLFLKRRKKMHGNIVKYNDFTKVYKISLDDGTEVAVVDFHEMDAFFENNNILFQNRKGLHKEIKRYIEFSLS